CDGARAACVDELSAWAAGVGSTATTVDGVVRWFDVDCFVPDADELIGAAVRPDLAGLTGAILEGEATRCGVTEVVDVDVADGTPFRLLELPVSALGLDDGPLGCSSAAGWNRSGLRSACRDGAPHAPKTVKMLTAATVTQHRVLWRVMTQDLGEGNR